MDPGSGPAVGLVPNPVGEPPDVGVSGERLQGVVAPLEVTVRERGVHVTVAGPAQVHGSSRVAPLELAPGQLAALHPPGPGAGQEVVAGEGPPSDGPAAQLAALARSVSWCRFVRDHPEMIPPVRGRGPFDRRRARTTRSGGAPGPSQGITW